MYSFMNGSPVSVRLRDEEPDAIDGFSDIFDFDIHPLRGGGSQLSADRLKHSSVISYESGHTHRRPGTCYTCLKAGLSCYNFIILLVGLGALGLGIWMMVKDLGALEVTVLVGMKFYEVGACLLIASGCVITVLAFCGCCGTMKEERCVLGFYATTLCIMLFSIVSTAALAFMFKDYLNFKVKSHMQESVVKFYGVDLRKPENNLLTEAWDSMQREIGCCGSHGNINSSYSWALYKSSNWYKQTDNKAPIVPESCCKGNVDLCTGMTDYPGPPWRGPPVPFTKGDRVNPHLHTEGCYDKLMQKLSHHVLVIGFVSAAIPIFLLVGAVIAFILCGMVKKDDFDDK